MLNIVSTPIGNLEDISFRQAKVISEAEVLLAEDTRSAQTLLQGIQTLFGFSPTHEQKVISYYKDNEFEKLPYVLDLLEDDTNICLISEAGTPVISDPGFLLLNHVIKKGFSYNVIPGPSAVTTALIHAGLQPKEFSFLGFLSKKPNDVKKTFSKCLIVKAEFKDMVFSFFESPHRINKTLELLEEMYPTAQVAVCRELTKKFEEVLRGTPAELKAKEYKGEITVVFK